MQLTLKNAEQPPQFVVGVMEKRLRWFERNHSKDRVEAVEKALETETCWHSTSSTEERVVLIRTVGSCSPKRLTCIVGLIPVKRLRGWDG